MQLQGTASPGNCLAGVRVTTLAEQRHFGVEEDPCRSSWSNCKKVMHSGNISRSHLRHQHKLWQRFQPEASKILNPSSQMCKGMPLGMQRTAAAARAPRCSTSGFSGEALPCSSESSEDAQPALFSLNRAQSALTNVTFYSRTTLFLLP